MRGLALGACLVGALTRAASAQNPSRPWRTITTEHFRVHFTPELDTLARRAAVHAESAYVRLRSHLVAPRGRIDLVVSDNVDYSNGSATPFPSNRIVVYANPPVDDESLRFFDDPMEVVITHELTHVFHLDRALGIKGLLRKIFGRDPGYFPNAYEPSWLVEGLAVYYESLLTGSGRLVGSNHRMLARTAAGARDFPRIDELSLAQPRFPYGYEAYAYGSLFVDFLGRTYGDSSIRAMVESSSRFIIPVWLNVPARRAFGTTFTSAYTAWTASQLAAEQAYAGPGVAGWSDLTAYGGYANVPRWVDDSTLTYDGTSGKESYAAYQLRIRGGVAARPPVSGPPLVVDRTRIARRTTQSANVTLSNGDMLYSQQEFTNPYDFRSDLYVDSHLGRTYRLTRGARLSHPDARRDGLIVAMQTLPGASRLTLVSADGRNITPITTGSLDEMWTEPRWSPDGVRVAAVRWTRGGTTEVAVIDTTGRIVQSIARERAVVSHPSWSPDGRFVYFSSDRTGITNLYRSEVRDSGAVPLERLSDTRTGLFEPQVSPDGRSLAAVVFRADGYRIGLVPVDSLQPQAAEPVAGTAAREPPPVTGAQAPSSKYSPWRSLRPRYWAPYWEAALDSNAVRLGAFTSAMDLVGRHAYQVLLYVPTDMTGPTGAFGYSYGRLGNPVIDVSGSIDRTNYRCVLDASQQNACVGFLRRRVHTAALSATFNRLRARTSSYVSIGGGLEVRDYSTSPGSLIDRVDSVYRHSSWWPRVTLSAGWSNVQHPGLAVSQEDGVSLALSSRYRWRHDRPVIKVAPGSDTIDRRGDALTAIASVAFYKSIPLGGFGHHVLAGRVAGGWTDSRAPDYLEVGGVSGGTVDIFPGYTLGEGRRSFPVRGFPAGAMLGMRAYAGSLEYRAPLMLSGRGLGLWPAFLDRSSLTVFGDVGSAWCENLYVTRQPPAYSLCNLADFDNGFIYTNAYTIGSVGSELSVDAALMDWDRPIRYRVGVVHPVIGRDLLPGVKGWSTYLAVSVSF